MAIAVGDKVPDVTLFVLGEDGRPNPVQSSEVLGSGRIVLFAVPGAFSPGCSQVHLPGYVAKAAELAEKGVDKVYCLSVNDAWVMGAWADAQGADQIGMLSDGNAEFSAAMGLVLDGEGIGFGKRSRRYAAVIEDGVIATLNVEEGAGIEVSTCD
ncbi:UNVERIFIED_CONTAM: hypothetical protein GTU68_011331, partial [Idotea baltica]|nr:hypothetical protein [Idotea baltica]